MEWIIGLRVLKYSKVFETAHVLGLPLLAFRNTKERKKSKEGVAKGFKKEGMNKALDHIS